MNESKCRSCGAPIVWAVTGKGERIPMNAEPVAEGTHTLSRLTDGAFAGKYEERFDRGKERYVSHFATCPDAKKWRKPKPTQLGFTDDLEREKQKDAG